MDYIKHFNQQTANYLNFRPNYPNSLYQYLSSLAKTHDCAWDCGTGNGQAAVALTNYFEEIIATDVNQAQLDVAPRQQAISYLNCPAEHTPILANSVDLITIAQALHWFNFDLFYKEVRRVSKPEAMIAAWCYSLGKFDVTVLDESITELYETVLGDEYWPKERRFIDDEYRTIPFPFEKLAAPTFVIEKNMDFAQLIGYLNTWSAVKEYQKREQRNPINLVFKKLESAWGDSQKQRKIHWPLHLLVAPVFRSC
ncbi:ubiquinone/menaquinone biosynthesis methyltransferase [Legionella donaldsonii]|uniref:Ubiquinone/menaquinone biosynthesis methyltransferase n=1 Tax=Legionella donaldsonii TaxID=45060 RepID=A0A378J7A3_9GAMM|nr:class I SAM-dependent methyltransferase [Legionella donaldsonii]STX42851.1 ubiquinone/menaquinone biosynthesis methyltransferase [Legionella donaldsonii]